MANAVVFDYYPDLAGTIEMPADRGVFTSSGLILFQRQSLPTDPIGTCTRTFEGVVPGTEIHVYSPDGTEVAGVESCAANQLLSWSVYAGGYVDTNRRPIAQQRAE